MAAPWRRKTRRFKEALPAAGSVRVVSYSTPAEPKDGRFPLTESCRRWLIPPGGRCRKSLLQKGRADSQGRWIASGDSIRPCSALALAQSRMLCLQAGIQVVVTHRLLNGQDRKTGVKGMRVTIMWDVGGGRIVKKKKQKTQ